MAVDGGSALCRIRLPADADFENNETDEGQIFNSQSK